MVVKALIAGLLMLLCTAPAVAGDFWFVEVHESWMPPGSVFTNACGGPDGRWEAWWVPEWGWTQVYVHSNGYRYWWRVVDAIPGFNVVAPFCQAALDTNRVVSQHGSWYVLAPWDNPHYRFTYDIAGGYRKELGYVMGALGWGGLDFIEPFAVAKLEAMGYRGVEWLEHAPGFLLMDQEGTGHRIAYNPWDPAVIDLGFPMLTAHQSESVQVLRETDWQFWIGQGSGKLTEHAMKTLARAEYEYKVLVDMHRAVEFQAEHQTSWIDFDAQKVRQALGTIMAGKRVVDAIEHVYTSHLVTTAKARMQELDVKSYSLSVKIIDLVRKWNSFRQRQQSLDPLWWWAPSWLLNGLDWIIGPPVTPEPPPIPRLERPVPQPPSPIPPPPTPTAEIPTQWIVSVDAQSAPQSLRNVKPSAAGDLDFLLAKIRENRGYADAVHYDQMDFMVVGVWHRPVTERLQRAGVYIATRSTTGDALLLSGPIQGGSQSFAQSAGQMIWTNLPEIAQEYDLPQPGSSGGWELNASQIANQILNMPVQSDGSGLIMEVELFIP